MEQHSQHVSAISFVFFYRVRDTKKYIIINVFKKQYVVGYILLIITAASMFIYGTVGYIVLIVELTLCIVLNIKFIQECFEFGTIMIKKLIGRLR